jgi:hypothetical protein
MIPEKEEEGDRRESFEGNDSLEGKLPIKEGIFYI